jgi:dTDP-6-deoxy-L-talose 4-dehydrogenase (NAD+)
MVGEVLRVKIIVTGATGFVGRHLVSELLARGHEVTAVARDEGGARQREWFDQVKFVAADVHSLPANACALFGEADFVMHLAWKGLPNYRAAFHLEENFPRDLAFLDSLVDAGYGRLLVTGTCFECFPLAGEYRESVRGAPTLAYPLAKARLLEALQDLRRRKQFVLQWARLFYMFGPGQSQGSLLAQLDAAIDAGHLQFKMSGGEQLRDYLPVQQVAAKLATLAEHSEWDGVTHICSGRPITVRKLVENHIAARGASIKPSLGHYPYPDYEPMAFWGHSERL